MKAKYIRVILIENMKELGKEGSLIKVKPGYARNYLIPHKKAVLATSENMIYIKERKNEENQKNIEKIIQTKTKVQEINNVKLLKIYVKSSKNGKLFGSINKQVISQKLLDLGIKIHRNEIIQPKQPIRKLGNYEIEIKVNHIISTKIGLLVLPEKNA